MISYHLEILDCQEVSTKTSYIRKAPLRQANLRGPGPKGRESKNFNKILSFN